MKRRRQTDDRLQNFSDSPGHSDCFRAKSAKKTPTSSASGWKRIAGLLGQHKVAVTGAMVLAAVSTVFSVLAPAVMGGVTTALFEGAKTGIFDWERIVLLLVGLVLLYLLGQIFSYFQNLNMATVSARVIEALREAIDKKMHRMKLSYYDSHPRGEVLSVITNDVDTLSNALSQNMAQIVSSLITAAGILIIMLGLNGWLTLIAVVLVPLSLAASMGVLKASQRYYGEQQKLLGKMNGLIEEMYQGQTVIQTSGYQKRACEQFDRLNASLEESARKADVASGMISPITNLVNNAGYIISALLGCLFVLNGTMSVGNVQAMLQYTKQFSSPFTSLASMAGSFGAAAAAASRIFALLDAGEETPDIQTSLLPAFDAGKVEFRQVGFRYLPEQPLMENVSFSVKSGEKVAIVGPTGAGKTTLVNLLMRFYDIQSGDILIDGRSIQDISRKDLRSCFGMVLQDTWLFEGTIRENLAYGRDGLTEKEIESAAKAASADSFIRTLPGGYDFRLDEGAQNISQGEKQLLTIARAMACDPPIMILDEATSNVDPYTEKTIQKAMARLMKGRTSFVIAHRLSTIQDASKILYMENGNILESGTHDELMQKHGKYEALYNSQFS